MGILYFLAWILQLPYLSSEGKVHATSSPPNLTLALIMLFNNFLLPNEKYLSFQNGIQSPPRLCLFLN